MKKTNVYVKLIAYIFAASSLMYACSKDEESATINDESVSSVEDATQIEGATNEADVEVDQVIAELDVAVKSALAEDCRVITKDTLWPKTITIDFGTGCKGKGNRVKTGKIKIVLSDKPWKTGASRTITFENFTINGKVIQGTRTITYKGLVDSKPTWDITLKDGKIIFADSTYITRNVSHTRVWEEGFALDSVTVKKVTYVYVKQTTGASDDVFSVTGSANGHTRKGKAYTETIITKLVFSGGCKHIKTGVIKYEVEGKDAVIITYDNNNCSGKIKLESGSKTKEIDLSKIE